MSLASDYAATQAAAETTKETANASIPPSLEGPNATLSVDVTGYLLITPKVASTPLLIPPQQALAVAAWINQTFG